MASYTVDRKGREIRRIKLTEAEAWAAWQVGLRFSIFDPVDDDYRIALPLQIRHDPDRDTVTLQQGD